MTASITLRQILGFAGYDGDWRFSELRSALTATSGRSEIVGTRLTRCMTATRS
ncbi:hypothetical protein [Halomonas ventosae]|uniref:Uncharacterized protein n=1 Tax=Halomonas ventosae TaxID=229007 RepID=A0A4R6HCC2_9GAMM|nr:hypothetical protein [Halomonas ventosae]TDO06100.1 hypothetical protein DFO68_11220 [Halomonas ventosae]